MIDGPDRALCDVIKAMEEAVNELAQAVGLPTLPTAQILGEVVQSMNGGFIESKATIMAGVKLDTKTIIEQNRGLDSKQDAMMEKLTEQSRIFNDAVQRFGYVQMGPNFKKSFKTCQLKLDVVRLRLTRWGHSVGLAKANDVKYLQITKAPEDREQVEVLLSQILDLFADAKEVSERFQKRSGNARPLDPAEELDSISALLHKKMQNIAKERQGTTELEQSEWTMFEEKKFNRLIEDIGDLVNSLIQLFPEIQEEQCELCEEEVSHMNVSEEFLPLLKDVAAGQDKLLSDTVVKVIQSTTSYTNSVIFTGANNKGFQIGNNSGNIRGIRFGA